MTDYSHTDREIDTRIDRHTLAIDKTETQTQGQTNLQHSLQSGID